MRPFPASCAVVVTCIAFIGFARAGTIAVPGDAPTIQVGILMAGDGDVVLVRAGIYHEHLVVNGKTGITLKADGKVIVDANGQGSGLRIVGATGVTVKKLRFVNCGSHGVNVSTSNGTELRSCHVSYAKGDGIHVEFSPGTRLVKNVVRRVYGDGILDSNGPFAVNQAEQDLDSNRVSDVGKNGIALTGGQQHTLTANSVTRSAGVGIQVNAMTCTFAKNVVRDSGAEGMRLAGSGHSVEKNVVKRAGLDGIATAADSVSFVKNKLSRPVDDGIDVTGKDYTFTKNVVKHAGDNGFEMSGAPNTVTNNHATKSGGFDLFDDSAGQNVYDKNVFPNVGP